MKGKNWFFFTNEWLSHEVLLLILIIIDFMAFVCAGAGVFVFVLRSHVFLFIVGLIWT